MDTIQAVGCAYCEQTEVKTCLKCQKPFCTNHANKVCLNFCQDCFKDVTVLIDSHFKRIDKDFNISLNAMVTHTSECKRITLDGPDYVWYTTAINLLTDEEFEVQYEFHRFIIKLFEHLAVVRKIEKEKLINDKRRSDHAAKAAAALTSKPRKPKAKPAKDLRSILMSSGLTGEALENALKVMGGK